VDSMDRESLLLPDIIDRCPVCRTTHAVGVVGPDDFVVNCPQHGVAAVGRRPAPLRTGMDPEERLWIMSTAVATFLAGHEDGDFIVCQALDLPCNYAQLRSNDGQLWAEVCSRQWDCAFCGNRPLAADAVERIHRLGFVGGGPRRNFERRGLASSADLAHLIEEVLFAAYDEPAEFAIAVYPKRSDMTLDLVRRLRA